ncbi:MAG: hypothetical protein ACFFC6_08680 [Promethearchaeota archaeon]
MVNQKVKERICKDFFPNCTYCTCYSMCFPRNEAEDISSRALLEQENRRIKESQITYKTALIPDH